MDRYKNQLIELYKIYLKKYPFKLEENQKQTFVVYAYIIFTLFAVSLFGIFAINPILSTISNLKRQYSDNKFIEQSLINKLDALKSLDNSYLQNYSLLEKAYIAIPETSQIPIFTRKIEVLATQHGLNIKQLDMGKVELSPAGKKADGDYSLSFHLSLEGTEEAINNFISDIIDLDRIVGIDTIAIDQGQGGVMKLFFGGKISFSKKQ